MKTWILILLTATALSAQQAIPWGQEFRVNSYTEGDQVWLSVSALSGGGFVVCWQSYQNQYDLGYRIFAQCYGVEGSPVGGEFRVNSNTWYSQWSPSATGLSGGDFVMCWMGQGGSGWGIYVQRYNADGKPVGGEFHVNSNADEYQGSPRIASLTSGGFVVCWESWFQDNSGNGIFGQHYDAVSNPIGGEFRVDSYTGEYRPSPRVAGLKSGGFVVCWQSFDRGSSRWEIYVQRFNASGKLVGDKVQVTTYRESCASEPAVAALTGGSFVVCWTSWSQEGSLDGVFSQRFNADGEPVGDEFQVNTHGKSCFTQPAVAALADGGFVVCWTSRGQQGSSDDVFSQRFNAGGEPVGDEFQVNTYWQNLENNPSVSALSEGGFVVCWESKEQDGYGDIIGKRFPAEPQHHQLRPFALLQPAFDATVTTGKPTLNWQPASDLTVAYPWELEYAAYYDTLADFSTASFKVAGHDTTVKLPALKLGKAYFWKVLAKTYYGDSLWSEVGAFFVSHTATGVEAEAVPGQFAVLFNYPNPFNPSTTLRFELPKDGYATVKIYDLRGRLVKTLLSGEQTAGTHTAIWDGTDDAGHRVAAGVYFYQLEFMDANGTRQVLTQKMSLVK